MSKQRAYKLATELGVEITDYGNCLDIYAPPGKVFDGDTHTRFYDLIDGRAGLWAVVIDDLRQLGDCEIADCEVCRKGA